MPSCNNRGSVWTSAIQKWQSWTSELMSSGTGSGRRRPRCSRKRISRWASGLSDWGGGCPGPGEGAAAASGRQCRVSLQRMVWDCSPFVYMWCLASPSKTCSKVVWVRCGVVLLGLFYRLAKFQNCSFWNCHSFLNWSSSKTCNIKRCVLFNQGFTWWKSSPTSSVSPESGGRRRPVHPVIYYATDALQARAAGEASPARWGFGDAVSRGADEDTDTAQHEVWGCFAK